MLLVVPETASADFGIAQFGVNAREEDGTVAERAASHPFALEFHLAMNTNAGEPDGVLRRIEVDLPPGLIGNPRATPRCALVEFEGVVPRCSGSTQIGVLRGVVAELGQVSAPLYNLAPPPGSVAAFGVAVNGEAAIQRLRLVDAGAQSAIRLEATLPPGLAIVDVEQVLWGVPAAGAHDPERTCHTPGEGTHEGCSADSDPRPFLTLPARCDAPLRTTLTAFSLAQPPEEVAATAVSRDGGGNPSALAACESVPFDPRFGVSAEAAALAPTGLGIDLGVPQYEGANVTAAAAVGALRLELPAGLALNPPAAAWLTGCPAFAEACPGAAAIGTLAVHTPLVGHRLDGRIYLAEPGRNPLGMSYDIYMRVEDELTGIDLEFPARLEADPVDGSLLVTLADLPPFPFTEMRLDFAGGPRALLANPPACATHASSAHFTPTTTPQGQPVARQSSFSLVAGPAGPCPLPEARRVEPPSFEAGSLVSGAGAPTPFLVRLRRADTARRIGSLDVRLPAGLAADLGSAATCTETQIEAAVRAGGAEEVVSPSCPPAAALGAVRLEAGLGPEPLPLRGTVYLSGPYRGAPFSLTAIVPATAGPFDLGTIVNRIAVYVDRRTASLTARGDSLPQIVAGIPIELRSLTLALERPGFLRNPTSCEPATISATATSPAALMDSFAERFQVGGCAALGLRPRVAIRAADGLGRGARPSLRFDLLPRAGDANVSAATIDLPAGELLDVRRIRDLCPSTSPAGRCPPSSRLGHARIWSPLLDEPLAGPIFLRSPTRRLPDLSAELQAGGLDLVVRGRTAVAPGGRLRVQLRGLPDLPVSRASFEFEGGRRGIVVNSETLCAGATRAAVAVSGHNGKRKSLRPRLRLIGRC